MSHIAIKDLTEATTLDQTAMSELHGGIANIYPKVPGGNWPSSDQYGNIDLGSLDPEQITRHVSEQLDQLTGKDPAASTASKPSAPRRPYHSPWLVAG